MDLHPEAARARGIANGDWVCVETPEASVRARARINDRLDPRVAVGTHGWWQPCAEIGAPGYDAFGPSGSNFNLLVGAEDRDGQRNGLASWLFVRDPTSLMTRHLFSCVAHALGVAE